MPDSRSLCQQDDLVGSGDYGLQDLVTEILKDNRPGWTLEEVYMAIVLDRDSTEVPPSRSGLALAMVDFARLGFTLLGLHLLETEDADGPKTPHSGARAIPPSGMGASSLRWVTFCPLAPRRANGDRAVEW